ncbi:hypothetical protein A3762_14930 [Oleiphilus sp. HI0125]|nr:hypothetical protein A3762_14930 [Oleiphilus sp. HI0125]
MQKNRPLLRNNNFDLLRLIAALQVAFVHGVDHFKVEMPETLMTVIAAFPGVPIFFVISGFLISAAYDRTPSMRTYAINRLLRIYPALWFCFIFGLFTVITC